MTRAISIKAREQASEAYRAPRLTVADFRDVSPERACGVLDRYIKREADLRRYLAFNASRVSTRISTAITCKNPGWEHTVDDATEAHGYLMRAAWHCDDLIRAARDVRGWARHAMERAA